jgi:hypothetical protein
VLFGAVDCFFVPSEERRKSVAIAVWRRGNELGRSKSEEEEEVAGRKEERGGGGREEKAAKFNGLGILFRKGEQRAIHSAVMM